MRNTVKPIWENILINTDDMNTVGYNKGKPLIEFISDMMHEISIEVMLG